MSTDPTFNHTASTTNPFMQSESGSSTPQSQRRQRPSISTKTPFDPPSSSSTDSLNMNPFETTTSTNPFVSASVTQNQQQTIASPPENTTQQQQQQKQKTTTIGTCCVCSQPATFMCSLCGPTTHYCSQECQSADWPTHRKTCSGVQAQREAIRAEREKEKMKRVAKEAEIDPSGAGREGETSHRGFNSTTDGINSISQSSGPAQRTQAMDAAAVQALGNANNGGAQGSSSISRSASRMDSDTASVQSRKKKQGVQGRNNVAQWINRTRK
jgi:hypothetical protein